MALKHSKMYLQHTWNCKKVQHGLQNMSPWLLASQGYIVMPMEGGRIGEPQYILRNHVADAATLSALPVLLPDYHAEALAVKTGTDPTHHPQQEAVHGLGDEKKVLAVQSETIPVKESIPYGERGADEPDVSYLSWMKSKEGVPTPQKDDEVPTPCVTATAGTGGTDAEEVERSKMKNPSPSRSYSENDYRNQWNEDYQDRPSWGQCGDGWNHDWSCYGQGGDDKWMGDWGYGYGGDDKWMGDWGYGYGADEEWMDWKDETSKFEGLLVV